MDDVGTWLRNPDPIMGHLIITQIKTQGLLITAPLLLFDPKDTIGALIIILYYNYVVL